MRQHAVGSAASLRAGMVLAQDVRDGGRVVLAKGRVLDEADLAALRALSPRELHLLELEEGDLHEDPAGARLAAAVAGAGVRIGALASGAWPLLAAHKGVLDLDEAALARLNGVDDLIVYTQPNRQTVLEGELLGRAKIVPFATATANVEAAERIAAASHGLLRVRPFLPQRVHALVQEALPDDKLRRFRRALEAKLAFFGSTLEAMTVVASTAEALAAALQGAAAGGAQLLLVAGSKPMDPLDTSLRALSVAGARLEARGVPAHPGTLLWLASLGALPILGMPSCGLFSKATVLDLLLPRLLTGERLSRADLAVYGAGGLLTADMAFRFPSYSASRNRGELDDP